MFCSKCGNRLDDEAMICPRCGCATSNFRNASNSSGVQKTPAEENSTLATLSIVFAIIIPIVGLILGIVGISKYQNEKYKKMCIAAIPISFVLWIISFVILMEM